MNISTVGIKGIPVQLVDVNAAADKIAEVLTNPSCMTLMSARNLTKAKEYHNDIQRARRIEFYQYVQGAIEAWLKTTSRCELR